MTNKEELINALKVLVNYCNQYDSVLCEHSGKDFTPPHECMFWHTCYFDACYVCSALRYELERLENVGE